MMAAEMKKYKEQLRNEGKVEGLQEGIEKEKIHIAINLLKAGSDINFVSKITGLTVKEIKEIKL